MISNNIPIFCESPLFELIFPGVPTTSRVYQGASHRLVSYSEWTTDYTKEEFLSILAEKYDHDVIGKLYDLFLKGFITKEDIIKAGLHHVYACCDWMINRIVRSKAA